ncbi:MAG TPA: hypothetical protein VK453_24325 [Micromonosporaceae bacterium]|nr:hypothetical protein [Micromonosporaceae bacterium]
MAALGTRKLTATIDGDEVAPEVSSLTINSEESDSDFISFEAAASGGGRTYKLAMTMVQDPVAASLWDKIWSAAGTDIPVVVRPYGNALPTATQPHFTGTVTITEPDGALLGGDADPSTSARFTTEVEWTFTAKPTRVVA